MLAARLKFNPMLWSVQTELKTLEWWISGLMLNPLFFLISRLNMVCFPNEFNLQISQQISHSKVFSSELRTLFEENPICFPKHHSSNVWKLNSTLKTKQQCICRDLAKKPECWQDLKLKEPSLQNVTIFSRPGILFGALIYSDLHYFYSVTPFTSCVTPTWDVTRSTSSTWISRCLTNLTIKTKTEYVN